MTENRNNFLIGATVALVMVITCAAVIVFIVAPDGKNTMILITLLFANLASIIPAIAALTGVHRANAALDSVQEKATDAVTNTERILNGEMEGKIRNVLENLLTDRLTEPPSSR